MDAAFSEASSSLKKGDPPPDSLAPPQPELLSEELQQGMEVASSSKIEDKSSPGPSGEAAACDPMDYPPLEIGVIKSIMMRLSLGDNIINAQDWNQSTYPSGAPPPQRPLHARGACGADPMPRYVDPTIRSNFPNSISLEKEGSKTPMSEAEEEWRQINVNNINQLRGQLHALLHARWCYHMETVLHNQQFKNCDMPGCKDMKEVVKHMHNCWAKLGCQLPRCAASWRLLRHFRKCKRNLANDTCLLCEPFLKNPHAC